MDIIVGPTEVGKSSLATQLAIEWGCNYRDAIIKTANGKALRVLMVQSEDDRQDSREMARCIKFLKLTPEQEGQVKIIRAKLLPIPRARLESQSFRRSIWRPGMPSCALRRSWPKRKPRKKPGS